MELAVDLAPHDKLIKFLDFIYGEQSGYSYCPIKNPKIKGDWSQYFFRWPEDRDLLVNHILRSSPANEVYYSPALYREPDATKKSFQTTQVVWAEFDGRTPTEIEDRRILQQPSIKIQSSNTGYEHWYWRLDSPVTQSVAVEKITARLTYALGADFCWNSNRVLRPPYTRHHESGKDVRILSKIENLTYGIADFAEIPEIPSSIETFSIGLIPDALDVVAKYKWETENWDLFKKKEQPKGSKSSSLYRLSLTCVEMSMSNAEIYSLLYNADMRWKKYEGRSDQKERLLSIIRNCRVDKLIKSKLKDDSKLKIFSFKDFFEVNVQVDWIIPNTFSKTGTAILAGTPGVGKTQVTLQTAIHMALGKKFTDWEITNPQKCIIFSLEMNHMNLLIFLELMKKDLSEEEIELLDKNLHIVPLGEPLNFDNPEHQAIICEYMDRIKPNGIFVDSLGQAVTGSLTGREDTDKALSFVSSVIKNRYNAFCWFVHFPRKSQIGNKKPKSIDDLYGNVYIGGYFDLGLLLWLTGDEIEMSTLKNRLGEKPHPKFLKRTRNLNFEISRIRSINNETSSRKRDLDDDKFNF